MSSALGALSSAAGQASSVFNAVSQLFGGSGGVQLGTVSFSGMEVPENIVWGGKQDIVNQRLPGGKVIFNQMGIEYPPISWSGIFEGFSAMTRSRLLYTALNAGSLLPLSWNDRSYTVLIASYEATDTKTNWIPYKVTCLVLRDETLSQAAPPPSLLSQITGDIASAIGVTPAQLAAGVGTALQVAQTASQVVGAVTAGSKAALGLTTALSVASGVVGGAMALANSGIANTVAQAVQTGSVVLPAGSAASGIANLTAATGNAANLAALPIIGGLVGRTQTNMANAST